MYKLGARSKQRLKGVHDDLVKVVERAIEITTVDFTVLEGLRTPERQKALYESGASQTLNGRHITGHAVDLGAWVDGEVRWDWPLYHKIAAAMKEAAKQLDIKIVCGADWKSFPDGPHFELDRKAYP
jgi:peptidoglycan L-alanyl-D-glutamate endopeptidase CwlK